MILSTSALPKPYSLMTPEEQGEVRAADRDALRAATHRMLKEIRENPNSAVARAKRAQDAAIKKTEDERLARGYTQI